MASNKDEDWTLEPVKPKRTKKGDRPEICVIHTKTSSSLDFIHITKDEQLNKLKDIKKKREKEPNDSPFRMADECRMLNEKLCVGDDIGYHRDCYQKFTNHRGRLSHPTNDESSTFTRTGSSSSVIKDKVLFTADCIFCNKIGKKYWYRKGHKIVEDTTKFDMGGGGTVQDIAKKNEDGKLLIRIRDVDLFSVEAHYHPSCRKAYTRSSGLGRSTNTEVRSKQLELEKAHEKAFEVICETVSVDII